MDYLTYIYIFLGVFLFLGISLAGSASSYFEGAVKKKENIISTVPLTAAELAKDSLFKRKIRVKVVQTKGKLTDYYSTKHKRIAISEAFYLNSSVVALGITAHEVGHAITDAENNSTFKIHQFLSKISLFLNKFFILFLIAALVLLIIGNEDYNIYYSVSLISATTIAGLSFLLKLITISNEKNASRIGISILKEYGMPKDEIKIVKSIYSAALITYIGAIFMPFIKLIDFILSLLHNTIGRIIR